MGRFNNTWVDRRREGPMDGSMNNIGAAEGKEGTEGERRSRGKMGRYGRMESGWTRDS